ncbi:hypothetical protein C8R43DRAFT_851289, partial [Mycena crocata]
SVLENHIGTGQRAATGQYNETHSQVQGLVVRWIGVKNRIERACFSSSSSPVSSALVPGTLYTTIAVRHRVLPPLSLLGAAPFAHFLHKTSAHVSADASASEEKYF